MAAFLPDPHRQHFIAGQNLSADVFLAPEDESKIKPQHDSSRMKLTREEHTHALNIKERIESNSEIDNLSDFMYAQLAIICKDDINGAEERCLAMQGFRHEYLIEDRYNQACSLLDWVFGIFPEHFLFFGFSDTDGTYVFTHDFNKFEPKELTTPKLADDWLRVMY